MKILVLSDSHASYGFMRLCISTVKPETVIHLGDHYADAAVIAEENPHIRFLQVPGNCDRYNLMSWQPEVISCTVGGVKIYMTHGHKHGVKSGNERLISDARKSGAQIALYGHTHVPECIRLENMWVLNPGTCGSYGGSAGLIITEGNEIVSCRILRQEDVLSS